ncbi:MAG TPA: magnesium chelatase domain-containing protein, partial [Abditibacteriaceae bacterium]
VQALCAPSYFTSPRRTVTGADFNRVNVALAVIEKRLGMRLGDMDVYVNVVGGVRVTEPALDLGIALAVISSLHDVPLPADTCVFGEVGLAGEVRAVSHADRRATEAARLGFSRCVLPRAALQKLPAIMETGGGETVLRGVATLSEAVQQLLPEALGRKAQVRTNERNKSERDENAERKASKFGRTLSPEDAARGENSSSRSNTGSFSRQYAQNEADSAYNESDWDDMKNEV